MPSERDRHRPLGRGDDGGDDLKSTVCERHRDLDQVRVGEECQALGDRCEVEPRHEPGTAVHRRSCHQVPVTPAR